MSQEKLSSPLSNELNKRMAQGRLQKEAEAKAKKDRIDFSAQYWEKIKKHVLRQSSAGRTHFA